jgi:hypothetical protein
MRATLLNLLALVLPSLATQISLGTQKPFTMARNTTRRVNPNFEMRTGPAVLSAKDMLELPRPGAGVVNPDGDLALVPVSKYSFADKEYVF